MDINLSSSSSSLKNVSSLSKIVRKRTVVKDKVYCDIDEEIQLDRMQSFPFKKSRPTSNDTCLPGRDLRHERSIKLSKYNSFHGSPSIKQKQTFPRSRSMGTAEYCKTRSNSINLQEIMAEDTPSPEPKVDPDSGSGHYKTSFGMLSVSVIIFLTCYLYFLVPTENSCSEPGSFNHTARFDFHKLKEDFNYRIFGQELSSYAILDILNDYIRTVPVPERPLVLSLHGGMGVGKTLVARILEQHFASRKANVQWYFPDTEDLVKWVFQSIRECSTNVFILDDVIQDDKKIVTQLKDLLIEWPANGLVAQPTQIVFVITTNAGSDKINEIVIRELKQDLLRKDIPLSMFSAPSEFLAIPNLKFVPFLPLDRSVVVLCAKHFVATYNYYGQNYSDSLLDSLLSKEKFFPDDFPVLAKSGCKKVHLGL